MSDQVQAPKKDKLEWVGRTKDSTVLLTRAAIAIVFIVNGVAVALLAFGLITPPKPVSAIFGSIAAAFAAYALGTFVLNGVKYQATSKRKK